jgi:DNA polymerase-1
VARWAVYGFLALLAGICDIAKADGLVVAFDSDKDSMRASLYGGYKATRSEKPAELRAQMIDIKAVLAQLGVCVVEAAGLEADDVVASVSSTCEAAGVKCVIATSDRDAFCLITERTTVLRLVSGLANAVRMTPAALMEKYGVRPDQYLDYCCLRGDKSDNLPGVNGIGEKTAAKLLGALDDLDSALANPEAVLDAIGKSGAAKLAAEGVGEIIARNLELMTPVRNIAIDLERCWPERSASELRAVLAAWELGKLTGRIGVALGMDSRSRMQALAGMPIEESPF